MNNIDLFLDCLNHKEPLIDDFYCNDSLIITKSSADAPNDLMKKNSLLIERITAIKVALEDDPECNIDGHILQMMNLLEFKNMNFNEFTSFFPSLDVSYSIYKKLPREEKIDFLKLATKKFINTRHSSYLSHGYSATSLQVRKDFEKHKTEGSSAKIKVEKILKKYGYTELTNQESIINSQLRYHFLGTSAHSNSILSELKNKLNLEFIWQQTHQNKSADTIFTDKNGTIYICELKHIKETGGGQDKQVAELISLLSHKESNEKIKYISYLDGIYFNTFINPSAPKTIEQLDQIKRYLNSTNNYFLNTYGLNELLKNN